MGLETEGISDIMKDIDALVKLSENETVFKKALDAGADPMLKQATANANNAVIHVRTGAILSSIRKSGLKHSGGRRMVTIGVHRATSKAFYATPVEFGHGGPHPAPAHPFIRPAYDVAVEESYKAIRDVLARELG